MKPTSFDPEAQAEYAGAAAWYDANAGADIADRFEAEVERILGLIAERPQLFQVIAMPSTKVEVRRALVRRFPYALVFAELADEVRILSVSHLRRRPLHWFHRVPDDNT